MSRQPTAADRKGSRILCSRAGYTPIQQLELTDEYDPDPEIDLSEELSFHVHICGAGACPCEYVCTSRHCKTDEHGYGTDLPRCEGCDVPLQVANGIA
jgi:hypothetical protein